MLNGGQNSSNKKAENSLKGKQSAQLKKMLLILAVAAISIIILIARISFIPNQLKEKNNKNRAGGLEVQELIAEIENFTENFKKNLSLTKAKISESINQLKPELTPDELEQISNKIEQRLLEKQVEQFAPELKNFSLPLPGGFTADIMPMLPGNPDMYTAKIDIVSTSTCGECTESDNCSPEDKASPEMHLSVYSLDFKDDILKKINNSSAQLCQQTIFTETKNYLFTEDCPISQNCKSLDGLRQQLIINLNNYK